MKTRILTLLGAAVLVLGMAGTAAAAPGGNGNGNNGNGNGNGGSQGGASVPEIDPSSAAQAAALLIGGVLVFKASRRVTA